MITAAIVGASGYTGGELARLLLGHPEVTLSQVLSRTYAGRFVYQVHPNLRRQTDLKFTAPDSLASTDVLFLALPHGVAQEQIQGWLSKAKYLIDLSADFRLRDPELYKTWYGQEHTAPEYLSAFVYGLPELHREALKKATLVSGVGCNATAANLALYPLVRAGLIDTAETIIVEIKVGSSEGGVKGNPGSHHPARSGVIRTFSPFGHRHTAEVMQELGLKNVFLTMTSVDIVRGALATAHARLVPGVENKDLWAAYREVVAENPFLRLVKERRGVHRVPDPKSLGGANYADLGFEVDPAGDRVIGICAIDNLMKGAAGSAVQSLNLMLGLEETAGLTFPGLYPI